MGVVPTTIVPPRAAHKYVTRETIERLVGDVGASRVVTVSSPAGFGKTTAMLRWAELLHEQGRPVLWIAARAGIDSLASFDVALRQALVAAGLPAVDVPLERDQRAWLVSLSTAGGPKPVLFIDDMQLLSAEIRTFIEQLIASARDALTTVIASRGECGINLARLRSLGHLLEVRVRHLSFDADEASRLIQQQVDGALPAGELQRIVVDTQGWAAGLVLAAGAWKRDMTEGYPPEGGTTGLRHEFASYFAEEVVEGLPQDLRDFIIDTSILEELTPSACAAVVNTENARRMLEQVFERGLFLAELDRELSRYRYYTLFRDMVLGRLMMRAPERAAKLHRRASNFYADNGDLQLALDHAVLSGDREFLADQFERLADPMIYGGLLYRLDELANDLSWDLLQSRPSLLLAMSWRRSRRLAFKSSERLIVAAEAALAAKAESGELDDYAAEQMAYRVRHRRIMLEAARDNMVYVERESEALLADLGDDHAYLSCTLLAQLLSARRELYHFHDMLRLEGELRKALGRPGSDFASIALKSSVAPTLVAQGKTTVARQFLTEAHTLAIELDGQVSGLAALPALPLAEIHYECGELEEAGRLVEAHLPSIRQWGFVDQLASGYLVRARLAAAEGDYASALSGLEEAHLVAIECGLDRLRALVISEQIRMLVKLGHLEQAEQLFWSSDLKIEGEPVPTLNPTRLNEWMATAWLRLEMQRFRLVRSRKIAKRWLEFVRKRGATRSAVTFELLLAEIAVLSGNRSEARRSVRAAVELAEPGGWVRPFIDEGEAIGALLVEAYGSGPVLDTPVDKFAARLVSVVKGKPPIEEVEDDDYGLGSGLSLREVEILTFVSGGLRNREIGDRLGLTEGTVKWYMQQIYDKLGVRRRPQAVIRARQFGILS
ncbi:LuxR C-terminal-related transcriptional regulator [Novosphingobium sp. AAP93]|uniref:LuxR C-terminal-related transcriptional regulator n=1 Tax=Novosphingobium sp. AAP93 TaxID=1523427 RepID=UPI000ADD6AB6|nr:LuxR C-terminal-related transcriptional regulator [Novosphingobium sp. AAP93]